MSEAHLDEYDEYNFDQDKYTYAHGGKQRSKKEASDHTNHNDPNGHSRKIVTKLQNTEQNQRSTKPKSATGQKRPSIWEG